MQKREQSGPFQPNRVTKSTTAKKRAALPYLRNLLLTQFENAQAICAKVEERIIDTAVLGVDLHSVSLESLDTLATRLDIDRPWSGWKKHETIVPLLRPLLYTLAYTGRAENFDNGEAYPYREETDVTD